MVSFWKSTRPQWTCCIGLNLTLPMGRYRLMFCCPQVFLSAAIANLQSLISFVSCSYPNLKSVRELIYKRGYGKLDKQRIPLTDNSVIEQVSFCQFISGFSVSWCWQLKSSRCMFSGIGQTWNYLCWRPCPRDHDCRAQLQAGQQLPMAIPAEGTFGWTQEEEKSLRWRWRCW